MLVDILRRLDAKERFALWNCERIHEKALAPGSIVPELGGKDNVAHYHAQLSALIADVRAICSATEDVLVMILSGTLIVSPLHTCCGSRAQPKLQFVAWRAAPNAATPGV